MYCSLLRARSRRIFEKSSLFRNFGVLQGGVLEKANCQCPPIKDDEVKYMVDGMSDIRRKGWPAPVVQGQHG